MKGLKEFADNNPHRLMVLWEKLVKHQKVESHTKKAKALD
jgi:hypothetical protein